MMFILRAHSTPASFDIRESRNTRFYSTPFSYALPYAPRAPDFFYSSPVQRSIRLRVEFSLLCYAVVWTLFRTIIVTEQNHDKLLVTQKNSHPKNVRIRPEMFTKAALSSPN